MNNKVICRIAAAAVLTFGAFALNLPAASALAQQKNGAVQATQAQQPGTRTTMNAKEAFDMVSKEAEKGDQQAMFALASLYEQGVGTAKNYTKAVDWHHKAAVTNYAPSIYQLGLAYEMGKGVTANRDTAMKNFQKAAELKVPEAYYKLASIAMAGNTSKPDDKKALNYLKDGGITGGKGLEAIGTFYENGVGLAPNYTEALKWYKKAADAGLVEAMYRIGSCYEIGIGTPVNPKEAIAFYQKAANNKSGSAAYKLASIYMSGSLVPIDQAKAVEYMHTAVANGHSDAANELGVIYLQGLLGQPADTAKASQMFLQSAEMGNAEAMKNLAVMYRNGIGRDPDPARALRWYLLAQKAGFQPDNIGQIISELRRELKPEEVSKAAEEAEQWLKARQEAAAEAAKPKPAAGAKK